MIKAIIFDYDGVIVDSFRTCHDIVKIICQHANKECPQDLEEFRKIYGHTYFEMYDNLGFSKDEIKACEHIYEREIMLHDPQLFIGVKELIKELSQKYKLILLSANLIEPIVQKLKKEGLYQYFTAVYANEDNGVHLNKTIYFEKILVEQNLSPEQVISIGDREVDFRCSRQAGIMNVLLTEFGWGYKQEEVQGYNPPLLIKRVDDIKRAVEVISTR